MRRVTFAIIATIFLFAALVTVQPTPAHAAWAPTLHGSTTCNLSAGGSTGLCPTPGDVCAYWQNFYAPADCAILGPAYNANGQLEGFNANVHRHNPPPTGQDIALFISADCSSPDFVDGTAYLGCSDVPPPIFRQLGDPLPNLGCSCGDPINIVTGNMHEAVTDYASAGPDKLFFSRVYNGLSPRFSILGYGWQSNFDLSVRFDSGTATTANSIHVARPDGAQFHFTKSGSTWVT